MPENGHENSKDFSLLNSGYFILHHGNYQGDFSKEKFRVVFNASAKDLNNVSLNDALLVGPYLQSNIVDILTRWRLYPYAFSADIQKIYRQLHIHPDVCQYQNILPLQSMCLTLSPIV